MKTQIKRRSYGTRLEPNDPKDNSRDVTSRLHDVRHDLEHVNRLVDKVHKDCYCSSILEPFLELHDFFLLFSLILPKVQQKKTSFAFLFLVSVLRDFNRLDQASGRRIKLDVLSHGSLWT